MERNILFRKLREEQDLSDASGMDCPLEADRHIEHALILSMTSVDPDTRPTVQEVKNVWLQNWDKQLSRPISEHK